MASQYDIDDEHELNLFQEHFPHLAAPPTEDELEEVRQYVDLCSRMKKGWLSEAIRKLDAKKVERAKQMEQYNPFTDVPQYGKKDNTAKGPRFSDFPFSETPRIKADSITGNALTFVAKQKRNTSRASSGT